MLNISILRDIVYVLKGSTVMTRKLLHKNILIILCSAILFISDGGQVFADQNSLAYTDESSLERDS